jgi:predicted Zn-dependent protease
VFVFRALFRTILARPFLSIFLALAFSVGTTGVVLFYWSAAKLRAAEHAIRNFRRDEAQVHLDKAFPIRKYWDPNAHFLTARLARMNGKFDLAVDSLQRCQKLEGATARIQLEWVLIRALQGGIDEVEPGLWNCIQNDDPDSPFIFEVIAGMNMRALQFSRAATTLDRWVARDPNNAQAWEWRGWVLDKLHLADEAEVSFTRSLALDPNREQARYWLVELYLSRFKVAEAKPLVEQLLRDNPQKVAILSAAGQFRFISGDADGAKELFARALEIDPKDQDLMIRRAKLEMQTGNAAEAEKWLRRALALEEANSEVHYLLHQAIAEQPNREKDAETQLAIAMKYRTQAERFSRLIRELVPAYPQNANYASELGDILFDTKQDSKAIYWHLRALQANPNHIPSHTALAKYYERTGNTPEATKHRTQLERLKQPRP